ncbi:MAG TPA: class I SAM-dependent rRNA methyltransferase [Casimicrobiaceae bacterium]|nr:class I SAM-dependent rRNA methyltransferase [Casimicrobiaceae bacterium]
MLRATLRPGREQSVRRRHPWVFSGAIASVDGMPAPGATVALHSSDGAFLATAAWSPESQIRARIWSFEPQTPIDAAFIAARVKAAVGARSTMIDAAHDGCRLIHAESDRLPGVVADRYGEVVVVQLSSAGADAWRKTIVAALVAVTGCACVYERSDGEVRSLDGLAPRAGVVAGALPATVALQEDGLSYTVDVVAGQKTGFYLDQRDNRRRIRELAGGCDLLDCCCYSGGFTVAALAGGAESVLAIDSSGAALAQARGNVARNGFGARRCEWREADAFAELRALRDRGRTFDLIVLDPPKLAPTAQHAARGARAYKDLNLLALKLLRPGGRLATFSCSGGIPAELFQKIVAGAALDAGADAAIVGRLAPGADHPVALDFPEGDYLKGLLVRKRA